MAAWVYILASRPYGTLYVGVTGDLPRRVFEHRDGRVPGFTARYGVKSLVRCEAHQTMPLAIEREKRLKRWPRRYKFELIEGTNPEWRDLWHDLNL